MMTLLKPAAATAAISDGCNCGATAKSGVRELIGVDTKQLRVKRLDTSGGKNQRYK
jgi:hypothetical protein